MEGHLVRSRLVRVVILGSAVIVIGSFTSPPNAYSDGTCVEVYDSRAGGMVPCNWTPPPTPSPTPRTPALTPMQSFGLGVLGATVTDVLGNMLFGDSPADKAKAFREQQMKELQKQQKIQREKAAAAAAAAEKQRQETAFQDNKAGLENSMSDVSNSLGMKTPCPTTSKFPQINQKTTEDFWKGSPDEPLANAPCSPNDGRPHLTPNHFWDGVQNSLNNPNTQSTPLKHKTTSGGNGNPQNVSSKPPASNAAPKQSTPGQDQNSSSGGGVQINGTTPRMLSQPDPGGYIKSTGQQINSINVPPPQVPPQSWWDRMSHSLDNPPQSPGNEPYPAVAAPRD